MQVFNDPDVSHVDRDVDPGRDTETIATELVLADLQTPKEAVPRLAKEAKLARARNGRAQPIAMIFYTQASFKRLQGIAGSSGRPLISS